MAVAISGAAGVVTWSPAVSASAAPSASKLAPIHGPYHPKIDPSNFVRRVENRYLPFIPGTRFHYEGVRGTTPQTDNEVVLIGANGERRVGKAPKERIAAAILDQVEELLNRGQE